MKIKKFLFSLVMFFLLLCGGIASADTGNLEIDSSPINQTSGNTSSETSIGYQVAPYLFLDGTQKTQEKLNQQTEVLLKEAKEQSFTSTSPTKKETVNVTPANQTLFSKNYVAAAPRGGESHSETRSFPKGLIFLFGGLGIVLVGLLGIFLGRRYSKIFLKKQG